MATNGPSAGRTTPFFFLTLKERIHPIFADIVQIIDHAHMIFITIAFIQPLQALARVVLTLETEADQSQSDFFTTVGHVETVLSARDTAWAVRPMKTLLIDVALFTQKRDAQAAIHAAGRDHLFFIHRNTPDETKHVC